MKQASGGLNFFQLQGVFSLFFILAKPVFDIEGLVLCVAISLPSAFYHSTVYKDYPVLTNRMKITGTSVLALLTLGALLARSELIPGFLIAYSTLIIGAAWGGYAVYSRAKLIREERLLKSTARSISGSL